MSELLDNSEIENINIEESLQSSYLDYSMSVIIGRALPDVRDGLKPVHRRILYAMDKLNLSAGAKYKKSARIVGDVIGQYHPHGDTAVYDALVRMAQPFSMRMPLVDGQGNFGSIDGDNAAAMRYTEARMTRYAGELLKDLDKETVNMIDNYDATTQEPEILPTRVPNLLINGSSGIAVGMATNIPPHNPKEILSALVHLIDNPDATLGEVMHYVKAPDFPTGGTIYGKKGIIDAYETGRGRIKVRAKTHIEQTRKKEIIVIDELPYMVNKARLIESIANLVKDKQIDGISEIRDESDREGIRVVIELKRDAMSEIVLNNLFKSTNMQTTFGIIMLSILNQEPRVFSLLEMLNHFINPQDGHHPPHHLRAREGKGACPYPRRSEKSARPHRRDHQTDPREQRYRKCERGAHFRVRLQPGPGPGHPRHAPAETDGPRARKDRERTQRAARTHRIPRERPAQRRGTPRHHQRRAQRSDGELRRSAPYRHRG